MMARRLVVLPTALCFWSSPAMAQQVLYCVDTAGTGFWWDKQGSGFKAERFTR